MHWLLIVFYSFANKKKEREDLIRDMKRTTNRKREVLKIFFILFFFGSVIKFIRVKKMKKRGNSAENRKLRILAQNPTRMISNLFLTLFFFDEISLLFSCVICDLI